MERTSAQPQVKLRLLRSIHYLKIHPHIITVGDRLVSFETPQLGKRVGEWGL
jgi:hypothetical protein